ncbi:hypothetical protein BDW74DRAFT_158416 [Aspergillus multicolor]|uniref:uncharacterized protein n=1 Tax=Aspergillus multicolor TaxID=41759 RepID=UPI003CCD52AC
MSTTVTWNSIPKHQLYFSCIESTLLLTACSCSAGHPNTKRPGSSPPSPSPSHNGHFLHLLRRFQLPGRHIPRVRELCARGAGVRAESDERRASVCCASDVREFFFWTCGESAGWHWGCIDACAVPVGGLWGEDSGEE